MQLAAVINKDLLVVYSNILPKIGRINRTPIDRTDRVCEKIQAEWNPFVFLIGEE